MPVSQELNGKYLFVAIFGTVLKVRFDNVCHAETSGRSMLVLVTTAPFHRRSG